MVTYPQAREAKLFQRGEEPGGVNYYCRKCGTEAEWVDCWNGCDEGFFDGYDEDPLWYNPGDLVRCDVCGGRGGWLVCPTCCPVRD